MFITDPIYQTPRLTVTEPIIPNWVGIPPTGGPVGLAPRETLGLASDTFERALNVSAQNEPVRVTLGRDRIGAQIATGLNYASSLLVVCFWGRGPIDAIESFTVDDKAPNVAILATHYLGTTSQTVDAKLVSAFAAMGITHSAAFTGLAYSVFEFPVGTDLGEIHAVVRGVKPYDYRDVVQTLGVPSSYVYNTNPAVLLAHVISDATFGLGGTVDWAGSVAAFDACDDMTSGEKKRIIGLTLDRRLSADQWCDILRAHAGCFIIRSAGKYKLVPDAVASSVKTFSKATNTIIDKSRRWQRTGLDQQPNVVEVAWTDTSVTPWKTAVAVYPPNGIPPGTEELRLTRIELSGCHRYSQAMREVHERRNHGRSEGFIFTHDSYADALAVEPGDVYTVDDGGAFAGIVLRLQSRRMGRKGRFTLIGKKYSAGAYNNSAESPPTYVDTTLPTAATPPTVGAVTLTEQIVTTASGALPLSRILGNWPANTTYPFLIGYRVTVTDPFGVIVDTADVTTNAYSSPPLNAFVTYTVRVYARSSIAVSATASATTITLISSGISALAAVWSASISPAGWTYTNTEAYKIWGGDTALRIRTLAAYEPVETNVYLGANQSTPGLATQLLDSVKGAFPAILPDALSPIYDIGASRGAVFALLNIAKWLTLYHGPNSGADIGFFNQTLFAFDIFMAVSDSPSMAGAGFVNSTSYLATGRYTQFYIASQQSSLSGPSVVARLWAIEFDAASIAALMPTVTDNFQVTTLTTGPLTVNLTTLLGRHYIVCNSPQVTPISTTSVNASSANLTLSEVSDNTVQINAFDNAGGRVAVVVAVSITGVAA